MAAARWGPVAAGSAWAGGVGVFGAALAQVAGEPDAAVAWGGAGAVLLAAALGVCLLVRRAGGPVRVAVRGDGIAGEGWSVPWGELAAVVAAPGVISLFPADAGFGARHPEMAGLWAADGAYRLRTASRGQDWRPFLAAVHARAPHVRRGDGPRTLVRDLAARRSPWSIGHYLRRGEDDERRAGRRPGEVVAVVIVLGGWTLACTLQLGAGTVAAARDGHGPHPLPLLALLAVPPAVVAVLRRVWAGAPLTTWALALTGLNLGTLLTVGLLAIHLMSAATGVAALAAAGAVLLIAGALSLTVAGALLHRRRVWAWIARTHAPDA